MTVAVLVAFLVLTFWGTLAQANAESAGFSASVAIDRFFDSYFIWTLGVVPLPAFKSIAILACVNLVASMVFRMPRGWKNAGLWLMHVALLVLLAGGVAGSGIKREYNGFGVVTADSTALDVSLGKNLKFFAADDSLGMRPVEIADAWPYYVHFRGDVPMAGNKNVAMYKAYYDPFHFVPYAFMALFLLGAVFHYVVKVRGARKGAAQSSAARVASKIVPVLAYVACLVAMVPANSQASARPVPIWEGLKADSPVLVDSAVRPFESFARGFLDDVNGRVTYKCGTGVPYCEKQDVRKISAGNVVRLILNNPEEAKDLALFKVLRSDVAQALHLPEDRRYVSYADLLPARNLLELYASRDDSHPATLEMRRLLANVQQYESIAKREAFSVVVDSKTSVDNSRLAAEVLYHKANFALIAFILAFIACLLASLNMVFKSRKMDVAANVACIATAGILAVAFALRIYVAARAPLSSLYEIVLLVALLLMAFESGAFIFCKRRTFSLMVPVTFEVRAGAGRYVPADSCRIEFLRVPHDTRVYDCAWLFGHDSFGSCRTCGAVPRIVRTHPARFAPVRSARIWCSVHDARYAPWRRVGRLRVGTLLGVRPEGMRSAVCHFVGDACASPACGSHRFDPRVCPPQLLQRDRYVPLLVRRELARRSRFSGLCPGGRLRESLCISGIFLHARRGEFRLPHS